MISDKVWKDIDALYSRGTNPTEADLLSVRRQHKLTIAQTLDLVNSVLLRKQRLDRFKNKSPDILQSFFSQLLKAIQVNSVFEFGAYGSSLVARELDKNSNFNLTYTSYHNQFAELFRGLLPHGSQVVGLNAEGIAEQDVVICDPPVNVKSKSGGAVDQDIVMSSAKFVSPNGYLCWLTTRIVFSDKRKIAFIKDLEKSGLFTFAALDVPPGAFSSLSSIPGALLIFKRAKPKYKMIGSLRDHNTHKQIAHSLSEPEKKRGGNLWRWVEANENITFAQIEAEQNIKKMLPKGEFNLSKLSELISSEGIIKADKATKFSGAHIYLPEYISSKAAATLDELTVKSKATYFVSVDATKVNPRYLVQVLNSAFGRLERERISTGTTILRLHRQSIPNLRIPLPDLQVQNRLVAVRSKINALKSSLNNIQGDLDEDWNGLSDAEVLISEMSLTIDLDKKIDVWWRELPYPLATVYRRYKNSSSSIGKYEALLHFFEVLAVFTAMIGTSYARKLHEDSDELLLKWLKPAGGSTILKTDFNFWISVAAGSLKAVASTLDNPVKLNTAKVTAGSSVVEGAKSVIVLRQIRVFLEEAKEFRNSKSHGGLIKEQDAKSRLVELENILRETYSITAPFFRKCLFIQSGPADYLGEDGFNCRIKKLVSSDPQFEEAVIRLNTPARVDSLGFWMIGSEVVCEAIPFVKLGSPKIDQNTAVYVYNSMNEAGMKWISFDHTEQQEIIENVPDLQRFFDLKVVK